MRSSPKFKSKKILIIKLKKLGDVLTTTPTTRQLRKLYPNANITFLTEPLGAQVYKNSTNIDCLWVLSRKPTVMEYVKFCYKIYKENFDLVIDLYDHNKTALFTLFSFAKYRLGFVKTDKKSMAYNYTVSLSLYEKTSINASLHQLKLAKFAGTNLIDTDLEFPISLSDQKKGLNFAQKHNFTKKTIAFCAQSEREFAQVPQKLLVNIGNYLIKKGYLLYFVYGPSEKQKALKVYNSIIDKTACIIEYKMPAIAQVKAIFENCVMYVGNDGGNKHIAVAANICTIGLFFGDNPKVWTPDKSEKHRFLQTKNNKTAFNDFVNLFEGWNFNKAEFIKR